MSADARTRLRALSDLATPWAIHVAATLGIADHVSAGATTVRELADVTGADAGTLERMLRLLVAQGVFDAPRPGVVALNDVSRLLLDEVGWRPWLDLDGAPGIWVESWRNLLHAVRTGTPPKNEPAFDERLAADADLRRSFDELMAAQVAGTAAALASAYDWSDVEHVVDVGGGTGTLLRELLHAHAHLRGTLLEVHDVAAKARGVLGEAGLADRGDVVEGSFFEVMPAGDVYCLSQILHGMSDEPAAQLLRRCVEAGGAGTRCLVLEGVLDPEDAASTGFDLFMLTLGGGRQRTLEDFRALAERAGLRAQSATKLESGTDLVVLAL